MTDIGERLRGFPSPEDCAEAADEIERLRTAIEQAINSLQKDIKVLQELRAEILP